MQVTVVLLPGFPALDHALIGATVRAANAAAGRALFGLATASVGGRPIPADDGTRVEPDEILRDSARAPDLLVLCAGPQPARYLPLALRGALRDAALSGATLAAGGEAVHILSALGYLDGHRATLPPLPEPNGPMPPPRPIRNEAGPFAHDGLRLTGRGGVATAPMLLSWIASAAGLAVAVAAEQALGLRETLTDTVESCQRGETPGPDPIIGRMEAIMAANLATPLSLDRIASMLGLSAKQLRNRCQKCREATPARVYLSLRLAHARDLVEGTALPVAEIAAAAGFASASSFTRAFREAFGQSPRARRNPLRDDGSLGTWDLSTGTSAPSAAHA